MPLPDISLLGFDSEGQKKPNDKNIKKTFQKSQKDTNTQEQEFGYDEKTGKKYKKLHKVELDNSGRPILEYDNFDSDNLIAEAEKFLPHLRVPPDKDEMLKLRKLKAEQRKKQNEEYRKDNKQED